MQDLQVLSFIEDMNYDIRLSNNARWIDQKCTPDVLCIVVDCILNYIGDTNNSFTSKDIWYSEYANTNVHDIFRKVDVDNESTKNEYDKFFGQPIKLFSYAGILLETKVGRTNQYKVIRKDVLEFIALRERNALTFLIKYIRKVLLDSELYDKFDDFFNKQTKEAYKDVKTAFYRFTRQHTSIGNRGSNGEVECGRIFTKIINVLAFDLNKRGTEKGHISKHNITYDMLMYNRDNFRDIYAEKPKNISRKDYMAQHHIQYNIAYYKYTSTKAKRRIRIYNETYRGGLSEMPGDTEHATHIHHIFAANEYPEISGYLENLIALTPNQHLNKAHPNGNTLLTDRLYQHDCLLVKTVEIQHNIEHEEEKIYTFADFIRVLVVGFSEESFSEIEDRDFDSIKVKIELEYL